MDLGTGMAVAKMIERAVGAGLDAIGATADERETFIAAFEDEVRAAG